MNIILVRHGKSLLVENMPVNIGGFKEWVEKYDTSGILEEPSFPPETLLKASGAKMVLTSDLKRAVQSAEMLKPDIKAAADPVFREVAMSVPLSGPKGLKLTAGWWAVIFRCLWLYGYAGGGESFQAAKKRAAAATGILDKSAREHGDVLLVGHGFFNRMIGKELKKLGWQRRSKNDSRHWSSTVFTLER